MRLPPLSSLRGFEAAARLGSFAKAADELCLTQAAVSHQVRSLEKELGQQLFLRLPRELVLTDAGKDFLSTVETALQTLSHGMQRLAPYNKTATLIVACDPALARHWLVPGLVGFHAANPDTEVWLDTSEQLTDFDTQEVDVIIDRGEPEGSGLITALLFEEKLAPMASPQILAAQFRSTVITDCRGARTHEQAIFAFHPCPGLPLTRRQWLGEHLHALQIDGRVLERQR